MVGGDSCRNNFHNHVTLQGRQIELKPLIGKATHLHTKLLGLATQHLSDFNRKMQAYKWSLYEDGFKVCVLSNNVHICMCITFDQILRL